MNIQKIRYKNPFLVTFDVDLEVYSFCIVKLVLQPILENAVNYGINSLDGCGEIKITAKHKDGKIIISVADNGAGMSEEVHFILPGSNHVYNHGSGAGLVNVNNRIQILFGGEYGLSVESEPDEGPAVSVCPSSAFYRRKQQNP